MLIFIFVIAIIIIGIAIFLICHLTHKKYNKFVLKNSVCLKQLNEINSRYSFYPYINFDQVHTYDNEKFYDTISCADYLIYQLQFIRKDIYNQIGKIKINKQQYSKYIDETKTITQFGRFQVPTGKLKTDKLIKIEKLLIEKQTYSAPIMQLSLKVTLFCSKLNGQVYRKKSENFSFFDIMTLLKRLSRKSGTYYIDREIWDAICRVERAKVSNRMRFSIYARDGYTCRNCGVSERYAKLEIDHIIPIAKGGKTTYENLQTLCHNCNVEKGDTLY